MIISPEPGFWHEAIQRPTEQRHGPAPDYLVDALRAGHAGIASATAPAFDADLGAALRDLPAVVLARLHGSCSAPGPSRGWGRKR